jgi:hypothetical protein
MVRASTAFFDHQQSHSQYFLSLCFNLNIKNIDISFNHLTIAKRNVNKIFNVYDLSSSAGNHASVPCGGEDWTRPLGHWKGLYLISLQDAR